MVGISLITMNNIGYEFGQMAQNYKEKQSIKNKAFKALILGPIAVKSRKFLRPNFTLGFDHFIIYVNS